MHSTIFMGCLLATGRTKELTPELKENFIRFAKSLGLTDDHILFPVLIGNGHVGEDKGTWGLSRPDVAPSGKRRQEGLSPLLQSLGAPRSQFGFRKIMPQPRGMWGPQKPGPHVLP